MPQAVEALYVVALLTGLPDHGLVQQTPSHHESLLAAKSPPDKEPLQRRIDATDGQIDRLVYELYALTEEEIKIVEEATGP